MLEPWSLNHRRWKKRVAWALYQGRDVHRAACLHATSTQEAEHFRKLGLRQPIIVLPNGVNLPTSIAKCRVEHRQTRTALFMSRIHPKKGLPILLEAWARLLPKDWRLRIVGPDELDHASEIRQLADRLGIKNSVDIEPAVSDQQKWTIYEASDLFLLPTYSENFGIVVAEALGAELPVITTTGTPWKELEEWRCGWCVKPSADALFESLKAAVDLTDEQRRQMGRAGRAAVQERFSWEVIARQMRDAYQWIVGGGNPPACVFVQ
jgi:glycosyltransferase involved in cell wall biosynthesis